MSKIVIAQCTQQKRDEPCMAKDLYDESPYFRKQRAYALNNSDYWAIQSAKYGLVRPYAVIEPYDKHVSDIENVDWWASNVVSTFDNSVQRRGLNGYTVELLGGRSYTDPVRPKLEAMGYDVSEPLEGLGIGERLQKLDEMK